MQNQSKTRITFDTQLKDALLPRVVFNVSLNSKGTHPAPPPPRQTPGHLTFLKNFDQMPRCVSSLDGQMPHCQGLKKGKSSVNL